MKKVYAILEKYSFFLILFLLLVVIFHPVLLQREIPFSSNLLVSFFNPWAQEKFPGWGQGIPNKPVGIDDLRIFYPQRHFTSEQYKKGILPLWNPYSFSGNYHAGLSETAIFYPLSLLFLFLPQLPTWILLQILEPIGIAIGTYLFLRLLQVKKPSAIFGSIVFGFSGVVIVRMVEGLSVGHTLLWTPFVLFGIEGFFQKRKFRYLVLTLVAMSCSLFAGWFQFAFYTIVLGGIYALYRLITEKNKRQYLLISLPFIVLPIVTIFHLIPAVESFAVSSRGATTTKELLDLHLMSWSHLVTYLYPDYFGNPGSYNFFGKSEYKESILYIGVIPFVVSLFGFSFWTKNKYILFFSSISILGIFLGIDNPLTRNILQLPIPIVSSFLPNRVFYFATVGLSILSAYGMEILLAKKLAKGRIVLVALGGIFLAAVANGFVFFSTMPALSQLPVLKVFAFLRNLHIITQAYQIDIARHNLYLSDVLLLLFVVIFLVGRLFSKKVLLCGIFILTVIGQIYFAQKYISFSQVQFVFPPNEVFTYLQQHAGINRFVGTGNGYVTSNSSLFYDIYSPDGVSSMYIERYGQLVTYMQTQGKNFVHIPRIEIRINPSADEALSGESLYLLRFMQIDGIKYILRLKSDPATINKKIFTKVWENNKWEIYTFADVLPRIFWTSEFVVGGDNKTILQDIFHTTGEQVVLEKNPGFVSHDTQGRVHVVSYAANKVVLSTQSSTDGLVYISDNIVPQWQASIDGKQISAIRANYSFMAVTVPSGQHNVVLTYADNKEWGAFIISLISIVVGIVIVSVLVKEKKVEW